MQLEYAADLVFRSEAPLRPLCDTFSRQAILTANAEQAASFLGNKITPQLADTTLLGCNRHYLERLSALDDVSSDRRALNHVVVPKQADGHTPTGFNCFDRTQQALLRALQRPEFDLRGLRRADLKLLLPHLSETSLMRYLRRLRSFRLIKKVAGSCRYYLTRLGRQAIAACCRLTELTLIRALA